MTQQPKRVVPKEDTQKARRVPRSDTGDLESGLPASEILLGASRVRLLSTLLLHPGAPMHMRAIARQAKVALGLLQRELKSLEQIGLIERLEQGRFVVFAIKRAHPLVVPLMSIVLESTGGLPALLGRSLSDVDAVASIYLSRDSGSVVALTIVSEVAHERWFDRALPLEAVLGKPICLRILRSGQVSAELDLMQWQRLPGK